MFVKFCGFTREKDLEILNECRSVSAAGFIFHDESARNISAGRAAELCKIVDYLNASGRDRHILKVGVFVKQNAEEVRRIALESGLDALQLYSPDVAGILQNEFRVFNAARVKDASVLRTLPPLGADSCYLLDAYNEKHAGGAGEAFDWDVLNGFQEINRTIVAGGINGGNLKKALKIPGIYGIDLSSGIEDSPGIKSAEKMKLLDEIILEEMNGAIS